jgi:hypothetical protein
MTAGASGKAGAHSARAERREPAVDLYELLEVSPRASEQVIQAAYRVLARQHHPDANPELVDPAAERRIRQLNAAYEILSDSRARARYDHERAVARRAERLSGMERTISIPSDPPGLASVQAGRSRVLPSRTVMATEDDRFPAFHASTALLLLLVAGIIVLSLLFLWAVLDSPRDDVTYYTPPPPPVVLTGR